MTSARPVAPAATDGGALRQPIPPGALGGRLEIAIVRHEHGGALDGIGGADTTPGVVVPAPLAWSGRDVLLHGRIRGRTGQHVVALADGHARAPERNAAHKTLGAINGVEQPAPIAGAGCLTELLAEHAVGRKARVDPLARQLLGGAVGERDRRSVALGFDDEILFIVSKCY
jgi:hypothetical protein